LNEEIEEKRNALMKMFLFASLIFLISIALSILIHILKLVIDVHLMFYILIPAIILFIIGWFVREIDFCRGVLICMIGLCTALLMASLWKGQFYPVTLAMFLGFVVTFLIFMMMKYRYAENMEASALETIKGCWEIDGKGNIKKIEYPRGNPPHTELNNNIYGLIIIPPPFSTNKIGHIGINIFKVSDRNPEYEKKLIPYIIGAVEMEYDPEVIDKNGGMRKIIKGVEWEQVWGD